MRLGKSRAVAVFLCLAVGGFSLSPLATESQPVETVEATEAVWTRMFVELKSPPTADGTGLNTVRNEKEAFRREASQAGVAFKERFAFDVLWNGLSIEVDPGQLATLARLSSVKAVYPVETLQIPETTPGEEADMATALAMTGANVAQNNLGLTGAGIRVGVMDTGVDFAHPDLGGCFGVSCRVAVGHDFVGDLFNADTTSASYNPNPVPDPIPNDCNGHGTHVAGIIGANGSSATSVRGVAPGVTFGAYRVFGCAGSTTSDIMIAAMERALADGMQVLNMSIGSAFQWPQYPTAQAADRLVNKGVSVVASIGNSGANGLYSTGAPGVGKKVIGVASIDNSQVRLRSFTVTPDSTAIGYGNATGAPVAPTSGMLPMARTGTVASTADACTALPAGSLAGKAVLIRRGTCGFYDKARNAQLAGAAAVVLYNNIPGRISPTVAPGTGQPAITIPVVAVSDAEGARIDGRLATGSVSMTWTGVVGNFPNETVVSSFSSYGLSPDLTLKPDIAAPGGFIRSTYPLKLGSYATISGTSMASPHTAGAVALLLEARPNTPSNAVRTILQNSADPEPWWGNSALGLLDNVHRQGAGMVDVPGAVTSTTRIEPSALSLGESAGEPALHTLTLQNGSANAVTYAISHAPALATIANTFAPSFLSAPAAVALSSAYVTVPANGSVTVDVAISPNAGLADRSMYGGYIVFTPEGGGATYRVPYAGFKGDYQSITVLTPTPNGFPWLARRTPTSSFAKQGAGAVFTLAGGNVPYVLVHLDHQSRRIRMEVIESATGKSWHRAMDLEYMGRNSTATQFFSLPWDGVTTAGNKTYTVPNGSYILRMSVLKALGDEANPAHWETWDSPAFTIARP